MSLRGVLSPHYQQEGEADTEATQGKTEPPIWLRTLHQPPTPPTHTHTDCPHGSAWHAGEGGPTLFSATGAERTYRQTKISTGLPAALFFHELSHTISYGNYHGSQCNRDERRKQRYFSCCLSVVIVLNQQCLLATKM